jgi:hypothetical protein
MNILKNFPVFRLCSFSIALVLSCFIVSCESVDPKISDMPETTFRLPTASAVTTMVSNSNIQNGYNAGQPLASFRAEGNLEIFNGFDEDQKVPFVRISLKEETKSGIEKTALFEIQLDEAIDFPALIFKGQVVYLQNQLIVTDLSTGKTTNFFVDDGMRPNVISSAPTINSLSLMLQRGKEALNGDLKSCSCSCSCKRCWGGGDCGSATASCSCGGDSQSQTCRDGYNAECTACSSSQFRLM